MNIKKFGIILASTCLVAGTMVGCSNDTNTTEKTDQTHQAKPTEETVNETQYIEKEELKDAVGTDEYVILDARKAKDYEKTHIEGSLLADQDAANKGGDDEAGKANLKAALKEATGKETGNENDKYALVCYSGQSYAQKATELMIELGIPEENIYTLDGGMKAWEAGGEEYKELLK